MMPPDPRHWLPGYLTTVVGYFVDLGVKELRRRQRLIVLQEEVAFRRRNTPALERLQIVERCIHRAMLELCP